MGIETGLDNTVKTHVVVTMKDHKFFISKLQNETLQILGLNDMLRIDAKGTAIKVSTIAEIFTIEEYYNQYPDQRPAPYIDPAWLEPAVTVPEIIRRSPKNAIRQMIAGMKRFIRTNPEANNAKLILNQMIKAEKNHSS